MLVSTVIVYKWWIIYIFLYRHFSNCKRLYSDAVTAGCERQMPSILDQLQVKKLENRVIPEAHVLWLSRYCPFNDHYLTPNMTLSAIILTNLQLQIQINRKTTYLYKLCHRFLCRRQQAFRIYAVILKPFLLKFPLLRRYSLEPLLNIFCSLLVRFFG